MPLTKHQEDDKRFITSVGSGPGWPNWPYLPMKRYTDKGLEAGTLLDHNPLSGKVDKNHKCFHTVYLVSFWAVVHGEALFKTCEKKEYTSIDAMLEDGWQVD